MRPHDVQRLHLVGHAPLCRLLTPVGSQTDMRQNSLSLWVLAEMDFYRGVSSSWALLCCCLACNVMMSSTWDCSVGRRTSLCFGKNLKKKKKQQKKKTGNKWRPQRSQSRYMSTTKTETSDPLASGANGSCCQINNGLLLWWATAAGSHQPIRHI